MSAQVEFDGNFAVIESGKKAFAFPSPLSGKIVDSNKLLEENPSLIVSKPYESWIVKIKGENREELKRLKKAEEIVERIRAVIIKEKI